MSNYEEILTNVVATTFVVIFCIIAILIIVYYIVYTIKTDKIRQDYIKNLNEHDKAVIMDYKNHFWILRKNKKNGNNEKLSK